MTGHRVRLVLFIHAGASRDVALLACPFLSVLLRITGEVRIVAACFSIHSGHAEDMAESSSVISSPVLLSRIVTDAFVPLAALP